MTEVTLASLAMDFDVAKAEPAKRQTDDLRASARALEEQAKATTRAVRDQAVAQGLAGTAAGKAEASMRSLVQVYGNAFNADRQYGMSQEATAKLLLQNARAADALAKEQDATARAVQRLTSAYDPLAGEVLKTNRQIAEADKLFKQGTISASQFGAVTDGLKQKLANLETAQATGVKSSKALQQATLNLGRQFTDIGVSLAGGQNLGLVLIQQLPQIADGFAVAKQQGMGFKAVVAGIAAEIAPFLPILAGLGAVAGVVFGGAALAARALNKDNKDLVDSLGLTEKQLKHLKDKGVETGVTIGDVFKGTFNYIKGAVAPALAPVMKWFDQLFDSITKGAVFTVKAIVGGFAGAFAGVKAIWSDLPAVMGDLFASGANLAISAIEKLLNFATTGINTLIDKANAVSAKVNGPQLGALGTFALGRVDNPNAGAASKTADNAAVAVAEAYKKAGAGVDKVFADIGKSITKAAEDRIKKAAGDAGKTPKAKAEPRDMSEERSAQIAAQIEQALAEELRARLGMAKEISERAALERQIARATASAKQSRVDAQIAGIADDKGLSDLKKAELTLELQRLKFIEGGIADIQRQAITDKERADLAAEALAATHAGYQNQIDILNSSMALAVSAGQRLEIEERVRDLALRSAVATQEAITTQNGATRAQEAAAKARIVALQEIAANEKQAANSVERAYYNMEGTLRSAAQAIESQDWVTATAKLYDAFETLRKALEGSALTAKIGALGGVAAVAGSVVGGKGGSVIGGIGAGAAAGAQLGSIVPGIGTAIGAGVGAIIGGLGSLFGGGGAKKRQREQEAAQRAAEEAQRQQTIADTARQIEIDTLRASGNEIAAVALERKDELDALTKLDPALAASKQAYYDLKDAADAAAKAAEEQAKADELAARNKASQRSIILDLMAMDDAVLGTNKAVLAAREDELATLDPVAQELKKIYYARLDEGAAAEKAKAALEAEEKAKEAAYDASGKAAESYAAYLGKIDEAAQSAAVSMRALGDSFQNALKNAEDLSKSLQSFADGLLKELGLKGQTQNYEATRAAFMASAKGGNFDQSLAQAFLDSSKATQTTTSGYRADVALVRALAQGKIAELNAYPANLAALFRSIQADAQAKVTPYADGGVFTNGIVSQPTFFNSSVMGEAGPEAIVPLVQGPNGLGVRMSGGANDNDMAAVVAELRALRQQIADLQSSNSRAATAVEKTEGYTRNVTQGGEAMLTEAAS